MNAAFGARGRLPFLLLAGGAAVAAGLVWLGLPHTKEISSLWVFLAKLVPFVLAAEAIALLDLPERARRLLGVVLIPASFLVFFAWFVPKIFFQAAQGQSIYYYVLTLTPFVILALVLAYRLGGGRAATVRRLSYGMLLLMLSGIEDLAFLTVNHHTDPQWTPIPERWTWASHMIVVLGGHVPTKYQAFAFIAVHLVLAALVLLLPGRAVGWLLAKVRLRSSRHAEARGVVTRSPS